MMKQEFCELTGVKYETLSDADWAVITTVYGYHPMITDVGGKTQIADFYKRGGMGTMYDMFSTAELIEKDTMIIQKAAVAKENLEKEYAENLRKLNSAHGAKMQEQEGIAMEAQERSVEILRRFNR